jgi:hypothetical protein
MNNHLITILDYNKGEVVTYDIKELLKNEPPNTPDYLDIVVEQVLDEKGHNYGDCYWMSHGGYPTIEVINEST